MGSLTNNPPGDNYCKNAWQVINVIVAVLRSQHQPARKYAISLRIPELILHLTLHQDLNGHPFKTMPVQASSICNTSSSKYFSWITLWEHPHKCKMAPSAQYSGSRSPHPCNKLFTPANHRRAAQRRPGIKGGISSQKWCIPVFWIQRSVSRLNVLRASTIGSRASSATRPLSSIYSSHPAERAAESTSTHCSAPQSCPRLSTAQPAPRNRLTLYTTHFHCTASVRPFLHRSNVCRTSLTRPFATTVSKEKHVSSIQ
jgi:hypothetical protein